MQFLNIAETTTLAELANTVGDRNVESILAANNLKRTPNIGKAFAESCKNAIADSGTVDWKRQMTLLNTLTGDSDVFESASLLNQSGWKLLSTAGTLPNMLKIPESIKLPDSVSVLGNGVGIGNQVYTNAMKSLKNPPHYIDPSIFNEFSTSKTSQILDYQGITSSDPFQWFKIPWGEITLYSSLGGDSKDFPVYPEEVSDSRSASYTTMPDLLYQYEPWQVYESSGPRTNSYTFKFHRDMWSGDHRDGKANELIRFCEANCYPEYNGSAVNTALVTLLIGGQSLITGVLTDVSTRWSGPIGLDKWYLECELELTITEVAQTPLSYSTVRNKGLIG